MQTPITTAAVFFLQKVALTKRSLIGRRLSKCSLMTQMPTPALIMATASDSSIRDGSRAVGFAQEAVRLSGGREPRFLRTLAAAYAESGRFSEAIAVAQQAAVIATMQGKPDMAKRFEKDLVLFRGNLPLRENSPGN